MSLHCSVICFRGSHLAKIEGLLSKLDYRHVGSPVPYSTAAAASAAVDEPTGSRCVVRKAAYEVNGWTCLFDSEMVVMLDDEQLSTFARDNSTEVFAWLCEGVSRTHGFRLFAPELRRDILSVGGAIVTDAGDRLIEEGGIQWASATYVDVLAVAQRLGAPYDYFSVDRAYLVYTLDESHHPEPDLSALNDIKLPPLGDIVVRVVGRVPPGRKPWWKIW